MIATPPSGIWVEFKGREPVLIEAGSWEEFYSIIANFKEPVTGMFGLSPTLHMMVKEKNPDKVCKAEGIE